MIRRASVLMIALAVISLCVDVRPPVEHVDFHPAENDPPPGPKHFVGFGCCRTYEGQLSSWELEPSSTVLPGKQVRGQLSAAECREQCMETQSCTHFELNMAAVRGDIQGQRRHGACWLFKSGGQHVAAGCTADGSLLCFAAPTHSQAIQRAAKKSLSHPGAVCIVGQWRSLSLTAKSIRDYVLDPLDADAYTVIQSSSPTHSQWHCEATLGPRSAGRCLVGSPQALREHYYNRTAMAHLSASGPGDACLRRRAVPDNHQVITWLQLDACYGAVRAAERARGLRYAVYAYVRTDELFFDALPANFHVAAAKLARVPADNHWTGANQKGAPTATDNMFFGDAHAFEAIAHSWRYASDGNPVCHTAWTSETYQHQAYTLSGIRMVEEPMAYCKVDESGACRYPGELASSLNLQPRLLEGRPQLWADSSIAWKGPQLAWLLCEGLQRCGNPIFQLPAPKSPFPQDDVDKARDPGFCNLRERVQKACEALGETTEVLDVLVQQLGGAGSALTSALRRVLPQTEAILSTDMRGVRPEQLYADGTISLSGLLALQEGRARSRDLPSAGAVGLQITFKRALELKASSGTTSSGRLPWLLMLEQDCPTDDGALRALKQRVRQLILINASFDVANLSPLSVFRRPASVNARSAWGPSKLWRRATHQGRDEVMARKLLADLDYRFLRRDSAFWGTAALLFSPQGRERMKALLGRPSRQVEMQIDAELAAYSTTSQLKVLVDMKPALSCNSKKSDIQTSDGNCAAC